MGQLAGTRVEHLRTSVLFAVVLLALFLVAAGSLAAPARALAFADVTSSHPNYQAIDYLSRRFIVEGYDDGCFGPNDLVFRQQFAKLAVLAFSLPVSELDVCPFGDVDRVGPGSLYPDNFVAVVASRGITIGVDASHFAPYQHVSRAQVLSMVVRAANLLRPGLLLEPVPGFVSRWGGFSADHARNAAVAEYNYLLDGLSYTSATDPWAPMTRAEIAQILYNVLRLESSRPVGAVAAHVTGVKNETTLAVSFRGHAETVRLLGVDLIRFSPTVAAQGKRALAGLVAGAAGDVLLSFDHQQRDAEGRLLAYVWMPTQRPNRYRLANAELLRNGLSYFYHVPKGLSYADYLREAQQEAGYAQLGLWRTQVEAPFFFRFGVIPPEDLPPGVQPPGEEEVGFEMSETTSLAGWAIEDNAGNRFELPPVVLQKGEQFILHTGDGVATDHDFFWHLGHSVWLQEASLQLIVDQQDGVAQVTP